MAIVWEGTQAVKLPSRSRRTGRSRHEGIEAAGAARRSARGLRRHAERRHSPCHVPHRRALDGPIRTRVSRAAAVRDDPTAVVALAIVALLVFAASMTGGACSRGKYTKVTRTDGSTVIGTLVSIQPDVVVLQTRGGRIEIRRSDVTSLDVPSISEIAELEGGQANASAASGPGTGSAGSGTPASGGTKRRRHGTPSGGRRGRHPAAVAGGPRRGSSPWMRTSSADGRTKAGNGGRRNAGRAWRERRRRPRRGADGTSGAGTSGAGECSAAAAGASAGVRRRTTTA